ncbi:PREDICTED: uncharacterized protein LOC103325727 isoform X2 [Prunus mume]|uniref:Uncharacterized protein LOC103325727 isoform X2 n=1 Tax=Prunus mume TaxID=102107 RepID=A0ABM0NKH9_PRUMU|nr:PREDICTED: uncharacterized protein LOC103325727 isoform X2 [Prunus mume]
MAFASPNLKSIPHFLSPQPFSSQFSFLFLQTPPRAPQSSKFLHTSRRQTVQRSALREWKEYEEAVKRKDLAGALRFLQSIETQQNPIEFVNGSLPADPTLPPLGELGFVGQERDWEVLDTCLNADNMKLVGKAYGFLKDKGFLPSFGKFRNVVMEGTRDVTPTVLKTSTGLEATKFAPKKWGLSESSAPILIAFLGGISFLLSQGIDLRPNLAAVLGLAFADSVFLGGSCLAQISSYWPPNRRRILIHEAGHLLIAYLMGCPIRGVILDPIVAMQMGIQGQAGTQFWDEKMANDLAEGRLDGSAFDRYCMVLFAGIAAEALVYGEAEGGENDENLFRSICVLLQPPLSVAEMSNQARWSLLQSYNLLKWHKNAHRAAVEALGSGSGLSVVIRSIEEAMLANR